MTATSYSRGYEIYFDETDRLWKYSDNNDPVNWNDLRVCKYCGLPPTPEGYDACFGYIKDAISACCGHGTNKGYIIYTNGVKG